ncbi:MAG: hypothetical protein EBZ69_03755 [Alphaproteobacteria bacterium]|nr:hypothetical protein [Alphaproteobacteria bacterium]
MMAKQKVKIVRTKAPVRADRGPALRWQHSAMGLHVTEQAGVVAARVLDECVIDQWQLKGWLDADQAAAALRLRRDYLQAAVAQRVGASYSTVRAHTGVYVEYQRTPQQEKHYNRWRAVMLALSHSSRALALQLCCDDVMPAHHQRQAVVDVCEALKNFYARCGKNPLGDLSTSL